MDVHLPLNMTMIRPRDSVRQGECVNECVDIYKRLEKHLQRVLVDYKHCNQDKIFLWHEDRIIARTEWILAPLKGSHGASCHFGADRTLKLFRKWFHTT